MNRQLCFRTTGDYQRYVSLLDELVIDSDCSLHAYALMPNHVHLLVTGDVIDAVPRLMKRLAQRYAQYFNHVHRRSGHLWENRYRSSLVDSCGYLLACYRYIELNPVRAGIVPGPARYKWSSFATNGMGKPSPSISPHIEYLRLGRTITERLEAYLGLVRQGLSESQLGGIRAALDANKAFGSEAFVEVMERSFARVLHRTPRGRPRTVVPPDGKRGLSP